MILIVKFGAMKGRSMYSKQIKIGLCTVSVFALLASFVSIANAQDLFSGAAKVSAQEQKVQKNDAETNKTALGSEKTKPNVGIDFPSKSSVQPKAFVGNNNEAAAALTPSSNNSGALFNAAQTAVPATTNVAPKVDSAKSYSKAKNRREIQELFDVSSDLFRQMADIERQNALLALELKREQMRSEIDAIKRQRRMALQEEIYKKEEARRKQIEWEADQTRKQQEFEDKKKDDENIKIIKTLREQIEEKNKEFEEYKEEINKKYSSLIEDKNQRIADLTNKVRDLEKQKDQIEVNAKSRIKAVIDAAKDMAVKQKDALAAAAASVVSRSSSDGETVELIEDDAEATASINSMYAVLEVKGTGKDMTAKILNRDGMTFLVKTGTVLNSGHKVVKIEKTRVVVEKDRVFDNIQFPAGGALDKEIASDSPLMDVLSAASSKTFDDDKSSSSEPGMPPGMPGMP